MMIILSLAFILLFVIFLLLLKKADPSQTKIHPLTTFIGSLLILVINLFSNALAPVKLPEDYAKLNSPNIEPELVINSLNKDGYFFNFIIRNTGNLPADNIRFIFKAPEVACIENIPPLNRTLAAHSSMTYNPPLLKTNFEKMKMQIIFAHSFPMMQPLMVN